MNDETLRKIFEGSKTIAAVGLSSKQDRPSYGVCRFLQKMGYKVIPVNPNEKEVLGERAYPDLHSLPQKVDVVQIFRKPEFAPALVDDAVAIGAKVVWMQDGAGNPEAANRAEAAGLIAVVDDCMFRQYRRLYGDRPFH